MSERSGGWEIIVPEDYRPSCRYLWNGVLASDIATPYDGNAEASLKPRAHSVGQHNDGGSMSTVGVETQRTRSLAVVRKN